ncbi:MAG: glycoside hydrolase [Planctomycetes bacterium GWF2_41_51]|nr:MAG: glycoside hydrolase [Planctomycetes bacterium GWF2_41_51]HBG27992.1 family 65 glycosyl hydrolase [Phycisphaerales bacterium]
MGKVADKYLKIDPWKIIEQGFEPEHGRVSESIFSLGNEYMGVRGYFDEGYSGDKLIGSYFNGVFEEGKAIPSGHYKGMVSRTTFMVNAVDWLYTRISIDGETLDIAKSHVEDFIRYLDMKKGILTRRFIWNTSSGKSVRISFERFLSMTNHTLGCQRISLEPLNFSGKANIRTALDFSIIHEMCGKNLWQCPKKGRQGDITAIIGKTVTSGHKLFSAFRIDVAPSRKMQLVEDSNFIGLDFVMDLKHGHKSGFDKIVTNYAEKNPNIGVDQIWSKGMKIAEEVISYNAAYDRQVEYWADTWANSDVAIEGDPENQQGIRYCIFQLHQTYHGQDPSLNIGAKGLTGEAYNGNAFWDTETYCLPFYIFNNPIAARNLLEYRYNTLPKAVERAKELDCQGAFYPIATLDGSETCALWQHASLQLQAGTGVAYGIWHYDKLLKDKAFIYNKGIEILIQVSRMLATRGQWGQKTGMFGFFAVMGPDEFQMMVNNNCYTNFMGKKTFEYTLKVINDMKTNAPAELSAISEKLKLNPQELENWKQMAQNMYIPFDNETKIYEQHDGFFNLPHIDIDSIPVKEFPLYHSWSYDRIYRNDMIKQPDVLMFMFLYNQDFSPEVKKANYNYYEPRCIHESSLSPSIHSILAMELGKKREAYDFFNFSTRLDLDNYNRNTAEGLHLTSIAAAWMNIVYGFGGMRSDGEILAFNPSLPQQWNGFNFRLIYNDSILNVEIGGESAEFKILKGNKQVIRIYDKEYKIDEQGIKVKLLK